MLALTTTMRCLPESSKWSTGLRYLVFIYISDWNHLLTLKNNSLQISRLQTNDQWTRFWWTFLLMTMRNNDTHATMIWNLSEVVMKVYPPS